MTLPFLIAKNTSAIPATAQTANATTDASAPKLPPVSQSGPTILDRRRPLLALPETATEKTPPCVKFQAMWMFMQSHRRLVSM
jgi:hypothetical protein